MATTYSVVIPIFPENKLSARVFSNTIDLSIVPYTECNLACKFCITDKERRLYGKVSYSLQHMLKGMDALEESLRGYPSLDKIEKVCLRIYGGEPFMDKYINRVLPDFRIFHMELLTMLSRVGLGHVPTYTALTSNLVCRNIEKVVEFIKSTNVELATSFDFAGRFNHMSQAKRWYSNIMYLRKFNIIPEISIVGHKPNLSALMHMGGGDELYDIFQELYALGYSFKIEYYDDVNSIKEYVVSFEEYFDFAVFMLNYYPEVSTFKTYIDNFFGCSRGRSVTCERISLDVMCGHVSNCCDHKYSLYQEMIRQKGCLHCPYWYCCTAPCPKYNRFNTKDCIAKRIFSYIDENKDRFYNSNGKGKSKADQSLPIAM